METSSIPFSKKLGIQKCTDPARGIHELNDTTELLNSLGSIHASIVFALAEASSQLFLIQNTEDFNSEHYIPNLRGATIKIRSTTSGPIYSVGKYNDRDWKRFHRALIKNNRALIELPIHVMNESGKCIAVAHFEWFVFRKPQRQSIQ